jgi:FAD/FMN-containing dehydrogenase
MTLLDSLCDILGPAGLLDPTSGLDRYTQDVSHEREGRPVAVVRPQSTAEVAAVMRLCHAQGVPVVPQGGHTGLVLGGVPSGEGTELVISLERMNRIRSIDPMNFSMVVEAGCVLQAVHEAVEAADRFFPLSLGARGSCQIGGNIATNAGGINVLRWGMMRDLVLGLEMVLPDGQIWNGLRALRKDNTGYALKQLFIGAEGTLGVVTAACLKLFPSQTQVETAFLALPSVEAAMALFVAARRDLSDMLSAFELLPRACLELTLRHTPDLRDPLDKPAPVYVLLEASASGLVPLRDMVEQFLGTAMGDGGVLDGVLAESRAQARDLWRYREDLVEAHFKEAPMHLRTDIAVPISSITAFIAAADAAVAEAMPEMRPITFGHVGDGTVHYNVLPPHGLAPEVALKLSKQCEAVVFAVADRFGGSISAEHGIGRAKREAFLKRLPDLDAGLMQMIKHGIDPAGLMAPGRVL